MICGNIARLPIAFICTDHVYPTDIMLGDGAWAITNSTKYSMSIIGIVTKLKLREDGEVTGVRMRVEAYKTRFAKLGSKVELEVPYATGMSPFSGLVDMLEEMGVISKGTQPGEKRLYVTEIDGEKIKFVANEINHEIAMKLFKHPLCADVQAADVPEIDIAKIEDIVDSEEV